MTTKKSGTWALRMSMLMKRAWSLFKRGMVSFSMSLKISWQLHKGNVTEAQLKKMLLKGGMRA